MTSQAPQRRGRGDLRAVDGRRDIPQTVEGLVPPSDLDAEAAVLSAILLAHSAGRVEAREQIDHVLEVLKGEHFYSDVNGRVFEAALELHTAGKPVDSVMVASYLNDHGRLAQVGGQTYLAQLADATPAVAHVLAHAEIVLKKWHARMTIATAQRIAAEGYVSAGDEDGYLAGAAQTMAELHESNASTRPEGTMISAAVDEAMDQVRAMQRGGFGLLTGFAAVDEFTGGLRKAELTVLGAPPKTGKTSFARAVALNVATSPGQTDTGKPTKQGVIFVSLEMTTAEQVIYWACTLARVDSRAVQRPNANPNDLQAVFNAMETLRALPIVIYGRRSIRYRELRRICREAKARLAKLGAEPRVVIIDHIQLLAKNEPEDPKRTEAQTLGNISRYLGNLAAEYTGLPVLVLSQVTEDDKGNVKMRGSGDIEADAQHIWHLEVYDEKIAEGYPSGRSTSPREAALVVKRTRSGPKGPVTLWWTPATTSFSETFYRGMSDS